MNKEQKLITELAEALIAAESHLEYCGYGDSWERECAEAEELPEKIAKALATFKEWEEKKK